MIIIKYENENEAKVITDSQIALGFHLVSVSNVKEGNFLGFDNSEIIQPTTQPTNKEINDNLMTIMMALNDIYQQLPPTV